ncbi:hypothetical protein AM506_21640 [Rossellomorea vietnamensis]|uniref:Uncharacterized protein n=1 Tax=Rossellomorea vietnamensis TaxID=218284 RepID=A0A0N8GG59_9BACI|nr:hypothetical protein AM506_21640 [Rossellomorea vietnamensis]
MGLSPSGAHHPGVADDGVQRHVPWLRRQRVDPLTVMGQADQSRAWPRVTGEGQGAVVEAATHAHALAGVVEAHQRQQDQVQGPGRQAPGAMGAMTGLGLGDAEAVADHGCIGMVVHEPQAIA